MEFAHDLDLIMVVEEKRSLVEVQVREELYGTAHQPIVIGKKDEHGDWLFPIKGALEPTDIAVAIGRRLLAYVGDEDLAARVAQLEEAQRAMAQAADVAVRTPYFCSGCPHNTSTKVPEGMRAYAGIGCHYMVQWMDRATQGFTQMGGEGANWIGEAPFSKRRHVFQNLGDGTFNHSGSLAIRAALAAGVNVTYKILFNDAVAMTGGQRLEGGLTASKIARIVAAEGVSRIAVVSNEPWKYGRNEGWPDGATLHPRSAFEEVQRELATYDGVTVLIYDQTCAAEKRRRRKRGEFPDPDVRVMINDLVCEGCGDCGVKSNCVSIQPVETEFGRKRQIDQSTCNKDFSCINGFCPSFVTVRGGEAEGAPARSQRRRGVARPARAGAGADRGHLQRAGLRHRRHRHRHHRPGAGHGGASRRQGVRHHRHGRAGAEGRGGVQPSAARRDAGRHPRHPHRRAQRRSGAGLRSGGGRRPQGAGGDAAGAHARHRQHPRDAARRLHPQCRFLAAGRAAEAGARIAPPGRRRSGFSTPRRVAETLFGTSVGANIFLVGVAFQQGAIPLSAAAIERAIELNGEAVEMNVAAFRWGRRAAHDPDAIADLLKPAAPSGSARSSRPRSTR